MELVKLDISKAGVEISADMKKQTMEANALLHSGKGAGNDFLGWVHLPSSISEADIAAIEAEAAKLRAKADLIICIGIGGSYLGAKAVLEAMSNPFKLLHREQKQPTVVFAGQNISEDYIHELLEASKEHSIAAIVISKSGTTTEPAIAFRLIKAEIEKHNADASAHAATITAAVSAAVKNLSESGEILNEEQVKALIKEQVDGGTGGGYYGSYELTLAADGWKPARNEDDYENAGGMDYYQCIYDAELSDSTSELVPVGVVSPGSFYTTTKAGVLNGCETHDGFIRFFAQRIPEADIQATVTLFGKGGGSGETGSVSIGQGLKRDASGAIAVRIGEGLDFDSANALTVRKETVMTSEDLLDEEETQQEIVDMLK